MQGSNPYEAPNRTTDLPVPPRSRLGVRAAALLAGASSVLFFAFLESKVGRTDAGVLLAVTFTTTQCVAAVAAFLGARSSVHTGKTAPAVQDGAKRGAAAASMAMLGIIVVLCILRFLHNVKRRGVADIIDFEWILPWIVLSVFYVAAAAGVGAGVGVLMRKLGSPRRS